jgi:acetolactate decarboxylase
MKRALPLALVLGASCAPPPAVTPQAPPFVVKWVGAVHDIHAGATEARLDLADIAGLPHLYALGALAGLRGEITVLDGAPAISTVRDGGIAVDGTFQHQATLLVYAAVDRWREIPIPAALGSREELEAFIGKAAAEAGLSREAPFPFLLRGAPAAVEFHVVNKQEGAAGTPPLHAKFTLTGQAVEALGFYSERHQGELTHMGERTHIHARTPDLAQAGHVDALRGVGGMTLLLPETPR